MWVLQNRNPGNLERCFMNRREFLKRLAHFVAGAVLIHFKNLMAIFRGKKNTQAKEAKYYTRGNGLSG